MKGGETLSGWFLPDLLVSNMSPDKLLLSAAVRKTDEVDGVWVVCWLEALNQGHHRDTL